MAGTRHNRCKSVKHPVVLCLNETLISVKDAKTLFAICLDTHVSNHKYNKKNEDYSINANILNYIKQRPIKHMIPFFFAAILFSLSALTQPGRLYPPWGARGDFRASLSTASDVRWQGQRQAAAARGRGESRSLATTSGVLRGALCPGGRNHSE